MKIVFDARSVVQNRAGIGTYTLQSMLALKRICPDWDIIPFYFNFRGRFKENYLWSDNHIKPKEINYLPGVFFRKCWDWFDYPPLNMLTGNADFYIFPNFIPLPVSKGIRIITVHDLAFMRYPETLEPQNLYHLKSNFSNQLFQSDVVFTVSEFSKKELLTFFPKYKGKVYITPNGISSAFLKGRSLPLDLGIKSKYNLPEHYILFVGTIEPRKNLIFLLRVFEKIRKKFDSIGLVIIGQKGWKVSSFFTVLEKFQYRDDVLLPGYVESEDLPHIYKGASVFVFPSLYEGFGIPPLEALSMGVPVLTSEIESLQEVLGEFAQYLSLEDSVDHWAEKALEMIRKKKNTQSPERLHSWLEKFTWEASAHKIKRALEENY